MDLKQNKNFAYPLCQGKHCFCVSHYIEYLKEFKEDLPFPNSLPCLICKTPVQTSGTKVDYFYGRIYQAWFKIETNNNKELTSLERIKALPAVIETPYQKV